MNDSKEKLHKLLVEQGLYTKGYAEFNEQFSLPEKQQKLYSLMKEQGLYTKSPDEFTTQFFNDAAIATTVDTEDVKKKDTTESPLEGGGLVQSDSEVTTESDAFVLPTVEVGSSKPTTESPSEWSEFYAEGINPEPQTVKNYSIPSLFPKDVNNITDNPDDYERLSGDEAFDKAKSMGLYKFQDKKKETLFDDGDLFERSLSNIDKDLMGRKDDFVAPKLNYQLSEYGFTVEETGGFGITVTASNDNTEFFKVHDYRDSRNLKEAERLKAFIKKNKINSNSVLEDTKSILDKKRKFLDEEEIKNTVREFNNEAKEFIAERNGFVKQYEAFTAESEKFNGYSATEIANDPKLKEEYTAFLSQQKEVQSKMKSVLKKEELIKSKGYTIDRAAGGFYDMQSSQGNWVGGIFNKLVKGAISNTGKTAMRASMSSKYNMAQLELSDEQRRENLSKLAEADGIKIPSGLDYNQTVEWLKDYDKKETISEAWSPTAGGVTKTKITSYPTYEALSGKDKNEFLVEMLYKGKMFRNPFSETAASVDTEMGLVDAVDEGARKLWMSDNTTEKWEQMKSEGFWGGAVLGLAESLPAMVGGSSPYGWAQRTAQMFSMTSEAVYEEMESNPNFDDITEKEKAMVAVPIGLAVGALETIGLRNVISQKGLLNGVIARAMSKSTAETTAKTFSEFVKNDVKSMIAKGALTITGAGLAEFETGFFQEIADIEIKKIYNGVKDKEMFDTPDTLTDYVIQVATAGAQEMVGGFILGAPSAVSMAMSKKGGLEELPTDMFEVIDLISKDDKYRAMYVSKMKQRIISGEITKEEADIELARVNKMVGVAPSLPSGLSSEQKKEAFILVEEKNTLESEIDGKDKSLTKAKRERISKIDERLEEMSLEVEDSQAASEYVAELDDTKEKDPDTYWSVTPVSEEDAQNGTLIDVDGGRGLVTQEGDIKGVFKKIGSKVKGVADKIIQKAIEAGGVKLDNFDGYLTKIYERNGFRVASRVPFNEKYAPEGWSEEKNGRPDVVSMVYDPKNELDIEVKTFESPNEANAYRDSFLPKTETQGQDTEILGTEEELSELSDVLSKEEDTVADDGKVIKLNTTASSILQSVSKILPNLKIVVHKSSSDYKKATSKDGKGYYSKKDGVIHVNASKANGRTIPHEVFHAIFLESVKNDEEASRAAFNLMRSVRKSIGKNSKLAKAIDEFAGNYDEWVQNEERLAELIGIMADEYTDLKTPARNRIIEFFRGIAKKLGINLGEDWGANDQEVIDMMNTIARGFRRSDGIDKSVSNVIDKAKNSSNEKTGEQKQEEANDFTSTLASEPEVAIESAVEEEVSEEEINDIAEEEDSTPEQVKEDIIEEVKKNLKNPDSEVSKERSSKFKNAVKKVVKKIRNMLITFAAIGSMYAASDVIINNDFNNTIEIVLSALPNYIGESAVRGFAKVGLYDVTKTEQTVDNSKVEKAPEVVKAEENASKKQLEKYKADNTYTQEVGRIKDSHYRARKGVQDSLVMLRNQFFNDDGFTYIAAPKKSNTTGNEKITGVKGVSHFMILDDNGADLSTKTSDKDLKAASKQFKDERIGHDVKMTDYVPVFERNGNEVTTRYKIASELNDSDIAITRLHQYKYSDLDWKAKSEIGIDGVHGIKTVDGKTVSNFVLTATGADAYSRYSGASAVFIFKDSQDNTIIRDLSGSINMIRAEADTIMSHFDVKPSELTIGVYDAGSYTAKPASKDGTLETDQWKGFNIPHPHSGGALVMPSQRINQGEQKNTETREQKDGKTKGNRVFNNGLPKVKNVADKYYERVFGGQRPEFEGIKKIDKDRAAKIAKSFEDSKLSIKDVEVKEAYEAMASEVIEQYSDFTDAGYSVEINNSEPYKNSQEMIDDLRDNNRIKIFSTDSGFGDEAITDKQRKENPLLAKSKFTDVNGEPLLINDLFRAVHDFFGHAELGNGFGAIGEENAWNVHVRMFSPKAARAMTTETRAQNSYVNFSGINEEVFKKRDRARELRKQGNEAEAQKLVAEVYEEMSFAEQKLTLLPEEYSTPDGEISGREQKSVEEVVSEARDNDFRDEVIRDYLVRVMGMKVADANEALKTDTSSIPESFKNILGGLKAGVALYGKVEAFKTKLLKRNDRSTRLSIGELNEKVKEFSREKRKEYDTVEQINEKVAKQRTKIEKANEKRKNKLNEKDVNMKVSEFRNKLYDARDAKRTEVNEEITRFEKVETIKNNKRVPILTQQEIMDELILFLQKQPEYIAEGDKYKVKGEVKYRVSQSTTQAKMISDLQKKQDISPTQNISEKIRQARASIRQRLKGKMDAQSIKKELRNLIRRSLPAELYTKSEVMNLLKKIEIADSNNLENLMNEVTEFVVTKNVEALQKKIGDVLNGEYTKTENGIKKSKKISLAIKDRINSIKTSIANEKMTAEQIDEANDLLMKEYNELSEDPMITKEDVNRMVDIQVIMEMNNSMLMDNSDSSKVESLDMVNNILQELITLGKTQLADIIAEEKGRQNSQFEELYYDITGEKINLSDKNAKEKLDEAEIERDIKEKREQVKQRTKTFFKQIFRGLDAVFTSAEALDGLMNKISSLPSEMFGGKTQDIVTRRVDEATRKYKQRVMHGESLISGKLMELYGKNWKRKAIENSKKKYVVYKNKPEVDQAIAFHKASPNSETKKAMNEAIKKNEVYLTQNEMYYLYNQYKDPANAGSFKAKYGKSYKTVMEQITNGLEEEVREFADWQVDYLFPSLYEHYNEAYKAQYGTNMPMNAYYAGRIYRKGVDAETIDLLAKETVYNTAVGAASTKSRTNNNIPIRDMDGTDALVTYLHDMEHFSSHSGIIKDINRLFTNQYIKDAVVKIHGKPTMSLITNSIKTIANRGDKDSLMNSMVNSMNNVFILSRLAISPVVMIKQLTSFFTYANDIGVGNWIKYSAKNTTELRSIYKEVRDNSVYMQDRGNESIMRAIETYSEGSMRSFVPSPTKTFMVNMLMWTTTFGDKTAIYMGGLANYSYYKDKALKAGKTEQQAIEEAVVKFEEDTKHTQQSPDRQDKDLFQTSHPLLRASNMFLTTPKQYLRKEIQAVRSLSRKLKAWDKNAGSGTIGQNIRTLVVYHVVMPVLFQYVGSAFSGLLRPTRDDDDDDLLRAAIIGNLNAIFVVGEVFSAIGDYFTDKPWAGESVKSVAILQMASSLVQKAKRADAAKSEEKKAELWKKFYLELATLSGAPAPAIDKFINNYSRLNEGDLGEAILRILNYSDYQIKGAGGGSKKETSTKTIDEINTDYHKQLEREEKAKNKKDKEIESFNGGGFNSGGFKKEGF